MSVTGPMHRLLRIFGRAPHEPEWQRSFTSDECQARLHRLLTESILPFWRPRVLDANQGGYHMSFDDMGKAKPADCKTTVSQARTLWTFSRLIGSPFEAESDRSLAEHGYRFLRDRLWDPDHGGFHWSVRLDGSQPVDSTKHLYAQAFGMYALCQYALATRDVSARALAGELFQLIEDRAHDAAHHGYRECFNRDWSDSPVGLLGPLGVGAQLKLMNTHLHLLEAITLFVRLGAMPADLARLRLKELIQVQSEAVFRGEVGACSDRHAADWTPLIDRNSLRVSFGHDLENIWLLNEACEVLSQPIQPLIDRLRSMADYAIRYGADQPHGGFFDSGRFHRPADRLEKTWWAQAEAMVGLLRLHQLTGEPRYFDHFAGTLHWVTRHQADWDVGEWYASISPMGHPSGDKAGFWKTPYHTTRSMLLCLEMLARHKEAPTP